LKINILFTSVGRRVELVRAFRKAYEALGAEGKIIGIDTDPLAPALQVSDVRYIVPRLTSNEYISTLRRICTEEAISLIFPLIDPDIPVLAHHRQALEETGARLCVIPESAVPTVNDKWQTYHYFKGLNINTPCTWLPEQLDKSCVKFPVFVKPRCGSAGKNAFRAENIRQLEFFLDYVPEPVVQEVMAGPEITSDVIVTPDGELLAVVSRKRIEVRWGEVAKGVTIVDRRIINACEQIAGSLPAVGPVTVQCMMHENEPHFTEINARYGGGVPLGIAAGVDSPKYLLARALRMPVVVPPLGQYEEGLYMTRFDESFFLSSSDYDAVSGTHI
jgi:carbamoyl-phosphate synthase large subunit